MSYVAGRVQNPPAGVSIDWTTSRISGTLLLVPRYPSVLNNAMRRSRFVAALLSGSFALQLLLASSGGVCLDPEHGSAHGNAAAGHAVSGMAMDMPGAKALTQQNDHSSPGEAPCDRPVKPGDCQVLAPCAGGLLISPRDCGEAGARLESRAVARLAVALSSRTIAPELPPPRA